MIFYSLVHPIIRKQLKLIDNTPFSLGGCEMPKSWFMMLLADIATFEVAVKLDSKIILN